MKRQYMAQESYEFALSGTRKSVLFLLLMSLLAAVSTAAMAAAPPQSRLTKHFSPYNYKSTATIDNSAYAAFLKKYVIVRDDGPNLLRYAKVTPADHKRLQAYIKQLAQVPLAKYDRKVQLAYWLNLYNAALINLVLDHYPVDSVQDIGGIMSSPWETPVVTIDGFRLTLADIRDQIIGPIWRQMAMVYYGLSYAAYGGPELRAKPYVGHGIQVQLMNNGQHFVNSPQGLTTKDNKLVASKFFDWHRKAFGRSTIALIHQMREYAEPALSARLDLFKTISGFKFDWRLNDAATRKDKN